MKVFALFMALFALASSVLALKDEVCGLTPFVIGHCRAMLPFYSYDADKNECTLFHYGGCGGNANLFPNQGACEERCKE